MHCVDLGESFQTHIFLQNLASIQPRTSPVKFARPTDSRPPGNPPTRSAAQALFVDCLGDSGRLLLVVASVASFGETFKAESKIQSTRETLIDREERKRWVLIFNFQVLCLRFKFAEGQSSHFAQADVRVCSLLFRLLSNKSTFVDGFASHTR